MRFPTRIRASLWLAAALALAGCSNQLATNRAPLTERQRDSLISRSSLPGSAVVGRAMKETDNASNEAAILDSLTNELPR